MTCTRQCSGIELGRFMLNEHHTHYFNPQRSARVKLCSLTILPQQVCYIGTYIAMQSNLDSSDPTELKETSHKAQTHQRERAFSLTILAANNIVSNREG